MNNLFVLILHALVSEIELLVAQKAQILVEAARGGQHRLGVLARDICVNASECRGKLHS